MMQCHDKLTCQAYVELGSKSTRLLNVINYIEMAADLKYIRMVLDVQYRLRMVEIMRPRSEVKPKQRMISDNKALK